MSRRAPRPSARDHQAGLQLVQRRLLLRGGLSLGALSLLTSCDLEDDDAVDRLLSRMSRLNDRAQAALFSRTKLAREYLPSDITDAFPFNAYYPEDQAPTIDPASWRLELGGMVAQRSPWTLTQLHALPQVTQITCHICIEGWSAIGQWRMNLLSVTPATNAPRYCGWTRLACSPCTPTSRWRNASSWKAASRSTAKPTPPAITSLHPPTPTTR